MGVLDCGTGDFTDIVSFTTLGLYTVYSARYILYYTRYPYSVKLPWNPAIEWLFLDCGEVGLPSIFIFIFICFYFFFLYLLCRLLSSVP